MAAGAIAASLSTASGLLLAISSALSHDLLKNTLTPNITDKQEMLYARMSMTGAIIVATWLGLNPRALRRRRWPWRSAWRHPRSSRR